MISPAHLPTYSYRQLPTVPSSNSTLSQSIYLDRPADETSQHSPECFPESAVRLLHVPTMEASSPLAAMYPPAAPSFGYPDTFRSKSQTPFNRERRSSAALFRDRLVPKAKGKDYFNVKRVIGSTPSGSLAADLSQNFRIDNEARQVHAYTWMSSDTST